MPLLSVVLAVYNGEKYLAEAIDSVLTQTYTDFEFFIVNDGSTDTTARIIQSYAAKDPHIISIENKTNRGQSNSWNRAIKIAKGEFIVRMDADDICLPDRFQKQCDYMLSHPAIGVLGSSYYIFSEEKKSKKEVRTFYTISDGRPPVHHPTCFIRKELFEKFGYYNSRYDNAEDTELWYRFYSQGALLANLDDCLLLYRIHGSNTSIKKIKKQIYLQLKINFLALVKYRIKFSLSGYVRMVEQLFYFMYLSMRLDKVYQKGGTNI